MSTCENLDNKYLRHYEGGIHLIIERTGIIYDKKFSYRANGGYEKTWKIAREHRDNKHIELFGFPISKRFFHVKKKNNSVDNSLPPGLAHGYSRGRLLYIVVSWCDTPGIVHRKRWNIKKIGYDKAIEQAILFRTQIITNIICNQ